MNTHTHYMKIDGRDDDDDDDDGVGVKYNMDHMADL